MKQRQPSARESLRDKQRANGRGPRSTFAEGIANAAANKRGVSGELRDENGAFTLVGRKPLTGVRRMWLAGISAQRGY